MRDRGMYGAFIDIPAWTLRKCTIDDIALLQVYRHIVSELHSDEM